MTPKEKALGRKMKYDWLDKCIQICGYFDENNNVWGLDTELGNRDLIRSMFFKIIGKRIDIALQEQAKEIFKEIEENKGFIIMNDFTPNKNQWEDFKQKYEVKITK